MSVAVDVSHVQFSVTVRGLGKFFVDRSADSLLSITRHPTKLGVTNVAKRLIGGAISDDFVNGYDQGNDQHAADNRIARPIAITPRLPAAGSMD